MKDNPLVSILMNCYNGEEYLKEAIDSVINQEYKNWELIFWDNQSTDRSAEIFFEYKDPRLKYCYSPTRTSLGDARILATKKMKGDWIGILDTDDVWKSNKLTKQIDAINNSKQLKKNIGLVYSRAMIIDKKSNKIKELCHKDYLTTKLPEGSILKELLFKGNFIVSASILINRSFFILTGGFPKGYSHASDYFIACSIASVADIICIDDYLVNYRIHNNNNTYKDKIISFEEQLKIFDLWSNYINVSLKEKKKRIKQLHTLAGLMLIKYEKNFIKGIIRILDKGSLFFAFCSLVSELKKLSKKYYEI